MKFKPNWPETKERLTALWNGEPTDRPCIAALAPNGQPDPTPPPVSGEQYWLDPDYITRAMQSRFAATYYGGEALPGWILMAGWVANTYGGVPHFPLNTIWLEPRPVDWDDPPSFPLDWNDPYFHKVLALHRAVLKIAGRDELRVGQAYIMPGNDMLTMAIGTETTLLAMAERPEWTKNAILQLARNWVTLNRYFFDLARQTSEFWYGLCGWMDLWLPEPFVVTQSDVSCMLSPEMFDKFILPELDLVGAEFGNVWYHLDGQSAVRHLPRLLSRPYIKVIQFVPEAGTPLNGPAHLDLYRRIQAAGKIVHLQAPAENIEELVKGLDPTRLMLQTSLRSPSEADELLAQAVRWTK